MTPLYIAAGCIALLLLIYLLAAARYQVPRIASIRGISEEVLFDLINRYTTGRVLGFLGEPRVNVLALNLALDEVGVE